MVVKGQGYGHKNHGLFQLHTSQRFEYLGNEFLMECKGLPLSLKLIGHSFQEEMTNLIVFELSWIGFSK